MRNTNLLRDTTTSYTIKKYRQWSGALNQSYKTILIAGRMSVVFEENEVEELVVVGFRTCPFYQEALEVAKQVTELAMARNTRKQEFETRKEFKEWLATTESLGITGGSYRSHTSSPFIYAVTKQGETVFVGRWNASLEIFKWGDKE